MRASERFSAKEFLLVAESKEVVKPFLALPAVASVLIVEPT